MNTGIFIGGLLAGVLVVGTWVHWSRPAEARAPIPHAAVEAPAPKPRPAPVLLAQVELRDLAALAAWHGGNPPLRCYELADAFMAARGSATPAATQ